MRQRLSIFADDVVVFIKPKSTELDICKNILEMFGEASGLRINMGKSVALPIRCNDQEAGTVCHRLGCPRGAFPIKYLGLPLTLRKQSAAQMQFLVDQMANCLPKWKAALMPKSGRLTLVQSVLCAMPIHAMMALDLPKKTISAMNKVCRGFLWCRRAEANEGNCAVAWDSVCAPKWAGGLGIPNLRWLNVAMQARWAWLTRVDTSRPWSEFKIKIPKEAKLLVQAAMRSEANCGLHTLFWEDRWLDGMRIQEIAPTIYGMIPRRTRLTRSVAQAVQNGSWASEVGPNIGEGALQEYLQLWIKVSTWEQQADGPDLVGWSWETNGRFSVRSAYAAKFWGRTVEPMAELTWKSHAPATCKFFAWLALRNRCWTSDRLARRGLPHQDACPLCDQEDETIDHVLLTCVFARSAWAAVCEALGMLDWTPTAHDSLAIWLAEKHGTNGWHKKDLHTVFLLTLWELWKHRNAIVFDGASPSLGVLLGRVRSEGRMWSIAGKFKRDMDPFFLRLERWASSED